MVVTLLGALTVISTKSLGVGIVLLVLTIGKWNNFLSSTKYFIVLQQYAL